MYYLIIIALLSSFSLQAAVPSYARGKGAPNNTPVFVSAAAGGSVDTNTSLLAYWNFDTGSGTTLFDTSGNGKDATLSGTYTWDNSRVAANHIFFNGGSSSGGNVGLSSQTKVSMNAWFRRNTTNSHVDTFLGGVVGQSFKLYAETDGLVWIFDEISGGNQGATYVSQDTNWHSVCVLFDGTQGTDSTKLRVYDNNVAQTLSFFGGAQPTALDSSITAFSLGGGQTGGVDEVRIFARVLTAAEILFWSSFGADNFLKAGNETPIASPWWVVGDSSASPNTYFDISSATLIPHLISHDACAVYVQRAWNSNQWAEAAITVTGGSMGSGPGVGVRWASDGSNRGYRCVTDVNGNVELAVANPYRMIAQRTGTWSSGDRLRLDVIGSAKPLTFRIYKNGTQLGADISDTLATAGAGGDVYLAGNPAVTYSSTTTTAVIDNFSAGPLP